MTRRSDRKDNLMLRGWSKFLHRLFLFMTFPIRRPLIFIPLLIIAYLAPTFMGAKPTEVHLWYWNKIKSQTSGISDVFSKKTQAIMPMVDNINISMPSMDSFKSPEKAIEQVVDTPQTTPQNIRRQMFEKAKETPEAIDVLKTAQLQPAFSAPQPQIDTSVSVQVQRDTLAEGKKKLPLIYADNEEIITGVAQVNNANELVINDKSYFLHGIYVDPNTQKGLEAKSFLKTVIGENIIKCRIKAFTYQGIGTAICTVNGENINRLMVDRGYSKNVALD